MPRAASRLTAAAPTQSAAASRRAAPARSINAFLVGGARTPSQHGAVLHLQRAAGNRAVAAELAPSRTPATRPSAPVQVQRHSSWEHAMLGDVAPTQLGNAAVTNADRKHVMEQERARMLFFQTDPHGNPTGAFPDIRWLQLRGSQLWVSNGELNALGDYLPDPSSADTLPADQLIPVLQRMRSAILSQVSHFWQDSNMAGMADSSVLPGAAGEVSSLDEATKQLGTNRYKGLVARNACHFAPLSWERWSLNHNEAAEEAKAHHTALGATAPLNTVDTSVDEHQRQALLKNGYADHFLQDSFAAGHLVNKTLVMQWFVDYLNGLNWLDKPWIGMPDDSVMARMGSAQQPGVAGIDRYGRPPTSSGTAEEDRYFGDTQTDPQTAQERVDRSGRVAGSGVSGTGAEREANYQAYLGFLNSAFLQLSAGAVHDYFNEHGLTVINNAGTEMRVGGDDTLLSRSDQVGAATAAQAAADSRAAIDDLLATGQTSHTVDSIFALVPQKVRMFGIFSGPTDYSLADFQADVIHPLCVTKLFPELVGSLKGLAVRTASAQMIETGVSRDAGTPPPPPGPMGDFPVPAGDTGTG